MVTIELQIGGVAKINGRLVVCIEDSKDSWDNSRSCANCVFAEEESCDEILCNSHVREDRKSVHFVLMDVFEKKSKDMFFGKFEPVGAVVEHYGKKVHVVEDDFDEKDMYNACLRCAFVKESCNDICCLSKFREDGKSIHYEIVEE